MKTRASAIVLALLLASVVTLSIPVVVAKTSTNGTWYVGFSADLVAGKQTDVGDVDIWISDSMMTIELTTDGDWRLVETHIHIAGSLEDIPQTGSGNPIPGQFEDNQQHNPPVSMYSYSKDISGMMTDPLIDTAYIAIHAVVRNIGCGAEETAWGGYCQAWTGYFSGRNWGIYIAWPLDS